ncbi:AzlD domain-containing protein [Pseudonocardia sp. C8]|uniref:AzlD domain-containing protein n=1 Tax=Pseudonocardia sp. C8 TaxID=2762759 RepID=UPI001642E742|nr:AzlD domain-containing protein [Pseudonocardia sp. C8]MBC3191015.1 AzlD domain-containing protein [Pseudonocardia sp. C8]
MRELLVLVAIGLGTYALRAAFLVTSRAAPPAPARLLPHVGPAVLAAITLPALLAPRGVVGGAESLPALVAAALTWLLWRRTARLPVALFGGLGAWWLAVAAVAAF